MAFDSANHVIGTYRQIKQITIYPKNHLQSTTIVGREKPFPTQVTLGGGEEKEYRHIVLKLTTRAGAAYAIDIAGAQYGYRDPVTPWEEFSNRRVQYITDITDSEIGRTSKVDAWSPPMLHGFPEPARDAVLANERVIAKHMADSLEAWLASKHVSTTTLMRGSKMKSDALLQEMIADLSSSIATFVSTAIQTKELIIGTRYIPSADFGGEGRAVFLYGDGSSSS